MWARKGLIPSPAKCKTFQGFTLFTHHSLSPCYSLPCLLEQCSGSLSDLFVCCFTSFQCTLQAAGGVMGQKGRSGHIKWFESFRDTRMRSKLLSLTNRALDFESLTDMPASLASPPIIPTSLFCRHTKLSFSIFFCLPIGSILDLDSLSSLIS